MWRADGAVGERRLPALLAVSLAVHAGALAWTKMPARPSADALPAVSMLFASLRLAAAVAPPPRAATETVPAARPREARRLPVRHDARAQSAVVATAGPTTTVAAPIPSLASAAAAALPDAPASALPAAVPSLPPSLAAPTAAAVAAQLDGYGRRLSELFSRQQQYPRLAALRGWEGEVRVRLSVSRQGVLAAVKLERSSGYEVLDRHALAMIEEIGRLPPPPAELAQSAQFAGDIQIVVPIHYKLRKPA